MPARIHPPDDDPTDEAAYRACEPAMPPHGVDMGDVVKPQPS